MRHALWLLLLTAPAQADLTAPDRPRDVRASYSWGPYRVEIQELPTHEQRLTVKDAAGRTLHELTDAYFNVAFTEITGRGVPELQVVQKNGGSCCSGIEHFFSREDGFRHLFSIDRGRGEGLREVRDLDGDGRPELLFDVTLWAGDYLECMSNPGCRIARRVIVGSSGGRYRDRTRAFPAFSRLLSVEYRDEVKRASNRQQQLAGFYGNALLAGEGERARSWVLAHASDHERTWFLKEEPRLRKEFLAAPF